MQRILKVAGLASFTSLAALLHPAAAEPLKVVASFSILADFASNVGGDRIALTTLVGPDGDAHVYEPKPADAAAFAEADLILVNGLHFEGFLERLVDASGTKATVVEASAGIEPLSFEEAHEGEEHAEAEHAEDEHEGEEHAEKADHDHGPVDPHAFQSIPNAVVYVKNIAEAFCSADKAGCETYRANAAAYTARLEGLDADVRATVAAIPADKRVIISSHDAFGYLGHEYGLKFLAPEGISTDSEASAADVARLIEQVRSASASAIFVENITNQRLVEQIARETGLRIGGTLYSDALSGPEGPAATYIDMMRNNIGAIRGAILGS